MKTLIYDGFFEGLLTSVFEVFEYKFENAEIIAGQNFSTENLFVEQHQVFTNAEKSARVLAKIEQISGKETIRILLKVFLSEHTHKEKLILKIKDKEIKWKKNPKLEKSLLNKKIKLLIKEEEIFEKSYLIKLFVYISISFGFLIFSIINLKNMFL